MSDYGEEFELREKPFSVVFFNNSGGSYWCKENAFDFENLVFYPPKHGCAYMEELTTTVWKHDAKSGAIVGYSEKHKIGFAPVDLTSVPVGDQRLFQLTNRQYDIMDYLLNKFFPQERSSIRVEGGTPKPAAPTPSRGEFE